MFILIGSTSQERYVTHATLNFYFLVGNYFKSLLLLIFFRILHVKGLQANISEILSSGFVTFWLQVNMIRYNKAIWGLFYDAVVVSHD